MEQQPIENPESTTPKVQLQPVNRFNWEACIHLQVEDYQQKFLPPNLFSLAQCTYEGGEPYAIYYGETIVGFMVVAFFSNIPWITRIMIDKAHQGNGYAIKALNEVINQLKQKTNVYQIRTTIATNNALAEHIFTMAGFKRKDLIDEKELMMILEW